MLGQSCPVGLAALGWDNEYGGGNFKIWIERVRGLTDLEESNDRNEKWIETVEFMDPHA